MGKAISLKIKKVIKVTQDAVSLHFKQPFFKKIKYTPGQFLTLLVDIDGEIVRRCYSLNSAPGVDDYISVTVKRIKDGRVSNFLFNNIKEGDKIKVLTPMGNFTTKPDKNKKRHLVLFGAGSGITPLISIMKSILNKEPQSVVSLIYGNRDLESIIFDKELAEYKANFNGRLNLIHILDDPRGVEECYKGRVERSQVKGLLEGLPSFPEDETEYYICGPSGMMVEAEEGLKACGIPEERIFMEKFTSPPPSAEETKAAGPLLENREVSIIHNGKTYEVPVKAGTTILDAALDEKINLPYVCMDGICGTCKATCTSGEVFMRKGHVLSQKELDNNVVLTCLCKPLTNNVVLDFK
ncbi:ferredoxin--NADP reductase [Echinicola jeungdonensis]|uniref:2Fe-2S iron-sulfur cluster-binding protein n=1 Tax=Echinicola jeungdonensis TaxID=709343 RepID=A0ABV5J995_9BACT|nr:ferredoxin--NADP reductase [Echinicola jeungdonensis]MDN3669147.1 ferredoxin--NADP reductase [Echinicola jeungdonensis]